MGQKDRIGKFGAYILESEYAAVEDNFGGWEYPGWVLQWSGPAGPRRYGPCGVGPREPAWARRAREPARARGARGARRGVAVLCSTV